ncbi:hypothetical protein [Brunnivagina elsteri]|uniref:Uncharacterized protein n=1 Tax=Brunnivagina elsteri CCALA 953 TaxID=987040 RepID=A0A2A2TGG1_9CYAN|nr:hypothetical protein [Calothrix elsteri]PAX52830.1 hypothetical protein CK510_17200 [Calothrix elsteri CCALA 953]
MNTNLASAHDIVDVQNTDCCIVGGGSAGELYIQVNLTSQFRFLLPLRSLDCCYSANNLPQDSELTE